MMKSLLNFKETFLNLILYIGLQLLFHIKHFHVLAFKMLKGVLLRLFGCLEEFIDWFLYVDVAFHWVVIVLSYRVYQWQGWTAVWGAVLLEVGAHWVVWIVAELLQVLALGVHNSWLLLLQLLHILTLDRHDHIVGKLWSVMILLAHMIWCQTMILHLKSLITMQVLLILQIGR